MPGEPPEWPPPIEWIEQDIREGDESSLRKRTERYRYVSERFPIGSGLFMGGVPQWFAFEEMQRSYISANYLAAVLCAQVFAEHSLEGPALLDSSIELQKMGRSTSTLPSVYMFSEKCGTPTPIRRRELRHGIGESQMN